MNNNCIRRPNNEHSDHRIQWILLDYLRVDDRCDATATAAILSGVGAHLNRV